MWLDVFIFKFIYIFVGEDRIALVKAQRERERERENAEKELQVGMCYLLMYSERTKSLALHFWHICPVLFLFVICLVEVGL